MYLDQSIDHNINLANTYLSNLDTSEDSYKLYDWYRIGGRQKNINKDLDERFKSKTLPKIPFLWVVPYDGLLGNNLDYFDYKTDNLVLYFIAASEPNYNYEKRKNINAYPNIQPFVEAFLAQLSYNKYFVQGSYKFSVENVKFEFHDNFGEKLYKAEGVLTNTDAIQLTLSPFPVIQEFNCQPL